MIKKSIRLVFVLALGLSLTLSACNSSDPIKALQKAANKGDAEAQYELGIMYEIGDHDDVPENLQKAVEWYKKSAEQRYAKAQLKLGLMYCVGLGVIKDNNKGCNLIREAAEQGNEMAISAYNKVCIR